MLHHRLWAVLLLVSMFWTSGGHAQECPASRLTPNHQAYIVASEGLAFYRELGDDATDMQSIANGEVISVFLTNQCIDGKLWAHIVYSERIGWVVEWDSASDSTFIDPVMMPDSVITESGTITSMAWLPDGGLMLGTNEGLERHPAVEPALIDPEGRLTVLTHPDLPNILATATAWGLVRIYDLTTAEIVYEAVYGTGEDMGIEGNVTDVVGFNEDASRLLVQTPDSVMLLDTATWREIWSYPISLNKSAYSPDGRWIAFADYARFNAAQPNITQIQLLEVETETLYGLSREDLVTTLFSLSFASDSQTLFAGDNKGNIQSWSVEDQALTNITRTTLGDSEYRFVNAIRDLPQDNWVLAAIRTASFSSISDDEIVVYQDGVLVGRWTTEEPFEAAQAIAVSPDGTQLAILLDGVVWVESVETFKANIHPE